MIKKIALFYHLNLSHYSLTNILKEKYLKEGIIKLAGSITVPCNFSLSAQDLEFLFLNAKPAYRSLLKNKNIKFHISTYSHFLPKDFPMDIDMQLEQGIKIFEKLIPKDRIIRTGLFAEFDIPNKKRDIKTVSKYVDTILVNHTLLNHSEYNECPTVFKYKLKTVKELRLICIHKDTQYRNMYHKYLREMTTSNDVIQAMYDDSNTKYPTVCHVDFEAPMINIVKLYKDGQSPPRYDLFEKLHNQLKNSALHFIYLTPSHYHYDKGIKEISFFQDLSLEVSRNNYYYYNVNKLRNNRKTLIKTNPKAYMEAINSDNFVINQKNIKLEGYYHGKRGEITIKKSGNRKRIMDSLLKELGLDDHITLKF